MGSLRHIHLVSRLIAAAALLLLSPILLVAVTAIKFSSKGPVLFPAVRAGIFGRPFVMLKFRTMHQASGSQSQSQRITGGQDSRVFPAGRWLRRLKIDELPQLANILRGDMVLVGPRPEDPSIVADYYSPLMLETLTVLPGLVSPGSLDYFAGEAALPDDSSEAERVYLSLLLPRKLALDVVYVRNRSWRYDTGLVMRTGASMLGIGGLCRARAVWEQMAAEELLADEKNDRTVDTVPRGVQ